MKKKYFNPEITIVRVNTVQMIAASLPTNEVPGDPGVVLSREGFEGIEDDEFESFDNVYTTDF